MTTNHVCDECRRLAIETVPGTDESDFEPYDGNATCDGVDDLDAGDYNDHGHAPAEYVWKAY